jgi:hypothetical protein
MAAKKVLLSLPRIPSGKENAFLSVQHQSRLFPTSREQ